MFRREIIGLIKERLEIVERVNRPGGPLNRREPHFEGDSGGGNGEVKCKRENGRFYGYKITQFLGVKWCDNEKTYLIF